MDEAARAKCTKYPAHIKEEKKKQLAMALSAGALLGVAARAAGISPTTAGIWLRKAKQDPEDPLNALILAGEAHAEVAALACIRKAMQEGHWQAAAWFLERRFPEKYSKSYSFRTVKQGPEVIDVSAMEMEDLKRLADGG